MSETFQIQFLDGYTDGRPSWRKFRHFIPGASFSREAAEAAVATLKERSPKLTFRIRKITRRR